MHRFSQGGAVLFVFTNEVEDEGTFVLQGGSAGNLHACAPSEPRQNQDCLSRNIPAHPDLKGSLIDKNGAPVFPFLEMTLPPDNYNPIPPHCPKEESF